MASISVAAAKNQFSDLLRRAEYAGERVVVHRHGKPVAAIVSTQDLDRLQALEDAQDVVDATAALKEARRTGLVPFDAVLRKHGLSHLIAAPARSIGTPAATRRKRSPPRSKPSAVPAGRKRARR